MMINIDNYELYAIDYLEGTLDKETRTDMVRFLEEHPLVKEELDGLRTPIILEANTAVTYSPKSELKKGTDKKYSMVPLLKYAAGIALLATSIFWLNNMERQNNQVAATTTESTKPKQSNTTKEAQVDPIEAEVINTPTTQKESIETPIKKTKNNLKAQITNKPKSSNQSATKSIPTNIIEAEPTTESITLPKELVASVELKEIENPIIKETTKPINNISEAPALNNTIASLEPREEKFNIPINALAEINDQTRRDKKKGQWLINAITKKSNGNKIFAFEGVKRALTPSRLRDDQVDKSSTDSPLKQLTND